MKEAWHLIFYTMRKEMREASLATSAALILFLFLSIPLRLPIAQSKSWLEVGILAGGGWLLGWPGFLLWRLIAARRHSWFQNTILISILLTITVQSAQGFSHNLTADEGIVLGLSIVATLLVTRNALQAWKNRPLEERIPPS